MTAVTAPITDNADNAEKTVPSDEALLEQLQRAAFDYFLHAYNPRNGLVADTNREGSPCTAPSAHCAF